MTESGLTITNQLSQLREKLKQITGFPWKLEVEHLPAAITIHEIKGRGRPVVHPSYGLSYGLSSYTFKEIGETAEFIADSPIYIDALLEALIQACGGSEEKAQFLFAHAIKSQILRHELIPGETS